MGRGTGPVRRPDRVDQAADLVMARVDLAAPDLADHHRIGQEKRLHPNLRFRSGKTLE